MALLAMPLFCVQSYAGEPEKNDGDAALHTLPCVKTVDSADASAAVTTFGGLVLDHDLLMILQDVILKLQKDNYKTGFVMVDIKTGKGLAYNPEKKFYSASSVKGIYVAALTYYCPESLLYDRDTIESVIVYSDNYGYEYLWETYGYDCIEKWAKAAMADKVKWNSEEYHMYTKYSAKDLAKLWILNYVYFEDEKTDQDLLKLYELRTTSRLDAVLGEKYRVRSKAGWMPEGWEEQCYVEGGIVYAGKSPYVVAFMSNIPQERMEMADNVLLLLDVIHQKG